MSYIASQNIYEVNTDETGIESLSVGVPLYTLPSTIGTSGQVLAVKSDLSGLEFVTGGSSGYKGFSVELSFTSAGAGGTTGLFTTHTWDTESGLNDANDWYVIPNAGKWMFNCNCYIPSSASKYMTIEIKNVTTGKLLTDRDYAASGGTSDSSMVTGELNCSVNDTIQVTFFTDNSNGTVTGTFQGHYLGN